MAKKKIYLYLLFVMILLGALGAGYYFWQKKDIRPHQGTLVHHVDLKKRVMDMMGKDVM